MDRHIYINIPNFFKGIIPGYISTGFGGKCFHGGQPPNDDDVYLDKLQTLKNLSSTCETWTTANKA
jgi:hypothetical protein